MRLTVVGSGDAFGAGGRLQACFHVEAGRAVFLIDCGVTALLGMDRLGLDPDRVSVIFVSHLHGDHFGGLVWWLLHATYVRRRTAPLTVAGPAGIEARFVAACEALYPGSSQVPRPFFLNFEEVEAGRTTVIEGVEVRPFLAQHPSGAPAHMLRLTAGGRVIAFSGDTEWVDDLAACADGADLFICECYAYREPVKYHLSLTDIEALLPKLTAKRTLITHMGPEMLAHAETSFRPPVFAAYDGLVVEFG